MTIAHVDRWQGRASWFSGSAVILVSAWLLIHTVTFQRLEAASTDEAATLFGAFVAWLAPWMLFPLLVVAGVVLDRQTLRLTGLLLLLAAAFLFTGVVRGNLLHETLLLLLVVGLHEAARMHARRTPMMA